jgi:hypothetical protein
MSFIELAHELGPEHALKGFKRDTGGKLRVRHDENLVLRSIGTVLLPSRVIGRDPRRAASYLSFTPLALIWIKSTLAILQYCAAT